MRNLFFGRHHAVVIDNRRHDVFFVSIEIPISTRDAFARVEFSATSRILRKFQASWSIKGIKNSL